ncbi:MAG: response regulator [Anaerolineales bacterium]|nr:response regulator [Anaerolineales bacterium]MCB8992004.1 response regulator [Ardenticatenaceae bacterium]MCB9004598.1 response regulator [Ardenticatenaceae bacterium]
MSTSKLLVKPSESTVLIVDDNAENRLLLSSQLSMEGYKIIQARGGVEGIDMARQHNPDIILLDVMMPDMNGFEVCKQLKQNNNTHLTPVIMVTALRETQYRIEGIEAGADEFLSRPHVREELLVRVRTLIQLKHARVRLEEERNRLQLLYNISRAIGTKLDLDATMSEIITQTQIAVGATKGNIMLIDENGHVTTKFLIRAGSELEISSRVSREVMTRGLGGWLIEHKRGDIIEDINVDGRWITLPDNQDERGAAIGVPLSTSERTVGVLILNHPEVGYFTAEHLALLETIGAQATATIENAYLFTQISEERSKMEAILAQSTDAILTTDEEWQVSLVNKSAERLFQMGAETVQGLSIHQIAKLDVLKPLLSQASFRNDPQEVSLPNGRTLYASISPIQGVGYAIVMQDVTEFKRIEEMRLEQEREEKQRVKETFSRYMGPKLVEHVLSHEPGLLSRRERRRAVVMFADLRNWTGGMIMKVKPDEAIEQLNEFFTNMMEIALEHDGTVFELTADELLVGFNAPFDQANAHYLALKTSLTMQQKFNQLRQNWYQRAGTELGLGIGIDLGDVLMGNVGAESRMSFRMVGEAMNKAHRLVETAEDGQVVISRLVYQVLQEQSPELLKRIPFEQVDGVRLKGISTLQTVYRTQVVRPPLRK